LAAGKHNIQGILMLPLNENDFHERINPFMSDPLARRQLSVKPDAHDGPNLGQSRPIADLFYEAQSKELNHKFQEALALYQTIIERKRLANEEERSLREKAFFEAARCYHNLNQNNNAVKQYQNFVKAFEHSLLVNDAWYNLGDIYYKANQPKNARICYQKAAQIPNSHKKGIINKAKQMLKKLDKSF
jgi:tetratricopeptide (TPR) repeat protein